MLQLFDKSYFAELIFQSSSNGYGTFYATSLGKEWKFFSVITVITSASTRSHPEMVDDMSRVTLNFDLSKIPFVHF